jgi:quercetin 2,3-dioxygenase
VPLIADVPLNESVIRYGLFVIHIEAEIIQAIEDYRNERMGSIDF